MAAGTGGSSMTGYQALIAGAIVLVFGALIVSQLAFAGAVTKTDTAVRFDAGNDGGVDPAIRNLTDTKESLETKLSLSGNGTGLQAELPSAGPGDAELCTYTTINDTQQNATVVSAGGELVIEYHGNRSTNTWVGARWNPGNRSASDITTPATSPGNQTHVCVRQAASSLVIAVDATDQNTTSMGNGLGVSLSNTSTLNGSIEETRLYSTSLSSSERSTVASSPTAPVDPGNATARLYYDARGQAGDEVSRFPVYYAGVTADVDNGTLAGGASARSTSPSDLDVAFDGRSVDRVAGSNLEDQPVAFITYETAGVGGGLAVAVLSTIEAAFLLAPVVLIALIAGRVLGVVPSLGVIRS